MDNKPLRRSSQTNHLNPPHTSARRSKHQARLEPIFDTTQWVKTVRLSQARNTEAARDGHLCK